MVTLKKLIFAPFFLIIFSWLIYNLSPILKSSDFIFSLSIDTLIQLIVLSALIFLSSFLFALFNTLASDWKVVVPVGILGCVITFIFLEIGLAIVLAGVIAISLLMTSLALENSLKSYLTFEPNSLLSPSIRRLSTLLILAFCVVYFLSINTITTQNGFQIPDSLIDSALKLTPQSQSSIPQAAQELTNDLIKQTVKDQVQSFIRPYLGFIPAILSVVLFFTLQSLTSLINLLTVPLLWITFYLLEKSGFIKFTTEMRPVKKMVI